VGHAFRRSLTSDVLAAWLTVTMYAAGTPVQEGFFELQQYLQVLNRKPLYHNLAWQAICFRPYEALEPMGLNVAK
jgi:hypothetical protein